MNEKLQELMKRLTGSDCCQMVRLTPAGSNRVYYRMSTGERTVIGAVGTSVQENRAFLSVCRGLRAAGLPAPELYLVSDDETCYLQEDFGDVSLFSILEKTRTESGFEDSTVSLLEEIMRILPDVQYAGAREIDFSQCWPSESFDRRGIMWDLNYFKYCFLKATDLDFNESQLEDDFVKMADHLLGNDGDNGGYETFLYRDFQSRNIMVKDGKPCLIDFQGGRRGPVYYDVASFLWQARAGYPSGLREHLIGVYHESLKRYVDSDYEEFRRNLSRFVLFRTLQVLGAYGFRGYFEHKAHFLQSIPAAIANVRELVEEGFPEYPYLMQVLDRMSHLTRFKTVEEKADGRLTVRVSSFSYRKGIPDDLSGNGGGFVFDCRSMHNPGLYAEYKQITGLDKPVIDFLEERGEIQKYLDNVYGLVMPAVDKYLERGFTSLMVSFGCTGGQHRSAYSAQHTAYKLKELYGDRIRVVLEHRELKKREVL